jgi:hypothetical protein
MSSVNVVSLKGQSVDPKAAAILSPSSLQVPRIVTSSSLQDFQVRVNKKKNQCFSELTTEPKLAAPSYWSRG